MKWIKCQNVSKVYGSGSARYQALKDVTFLAECGEFIAICGKSGSGKTTLFHILSGMDEQYEGDCEILGKEMKGLSDQSRSNLRNSMIGLITQDYNLLPFLTVKENIEIPVKASLRKPKEKRCTEEVARYFELEDKLSSFPDELSGGQQQRVAIARIQIQDAKIILADEPTGSLDSVTGAKVIEWLKAQSQEGKLVLIITHDQQIAAQCDRILWMKDGVLHE